MIEMEGMCFELCEWEEERKWTCLSVYIAELRIVEYFLAPFEIAQASISEPLRSWKM
jgi:hypothetical protein